MIGSPVRKQQHKMQLFRQIEQCWNMTALKVDVANRHPGRGKSIKFRKIISKWNQRHQITINANFQANRTKLKFDPPHSGCGQPMRQGGESPKFWKIMSKMKSAPSNYYKCKFSSKSDEVEIWPSSKWVWPTNAPGRGRSPKFWKNNVKNEISTIKLI